MLHTFAMLLSCRAMQLDCTRCCWQSWEDALLPAASNGGLQQCTNAQLAEVLRESSNSKLTYIIRCDIQMLRQKLHTRSPSSLWVRVLPGR